MQLSKQKTLPRVFLPYPLQPFTPIMPPRTFVYKLVTMLIIVHTFPVHALLSNEMDMRLILMIILMGNM